VISWRSLQAQLPTMALCTALAILVLIPAVLFAPHARAQTPSLTPEAQVFVLANGATQIALSCPPITATLIVSLNGLEQTPGTDYTISGMAITFLALDLGDAPVVKVHYWTLTP
jgi:hypothetical protein